MNKNEEIIEKHKQNRIKELRKKSGNITSSDPLVQFLYTLMRDGAPCGEVERAISETAHDECLFTNGYLALYAKDLAEQLKKKCIIKEEE